MQFDILSIIIFIKLLQMPSPSKMFSCVDSKAILQSPINNSTAKQNWSFGKSRRFSNQRVYCDSFYNLPSTKTKRNTSFGYGKKTDLDFGKNPHQVTPPPNSYSIPTFVNINKKHNKGFTPRYSRQEIAPVSYIDLQQKKVPGPGNYQQFRYNDTPHWTMHQRVNSELFDKTTQRIVPGPGIYKQVDNINPVGRYNLSTRKSSRSKVFNPPHSKRFRYSYSDVPGPGNYNPKNDLSNEGVYVLSKHVSAGKRRILMGSRNSFVDQQPARRSMTPGPGSYRAPSDFGHYDDIQILRNNLSAANLNENKTGITGDTS